MPACSIVQCGAKKGKKQPHLTLHRFPRNEILRRRWLETVGEKNINPRHKELYLCSLHFEDNCFNRTLDVARLRDNVIPTIFQMSKTKRAAVLCETGNIEKIYIPSMPTVLPSLRLSKALHEKENNSNDTINDCEEDPEQDGPQQNDGCLKAERPDTPEPEPSTFTNKVDEAVNDSVNDIPPDALTDRKKPDEDEYDLFGRSLAIQLRKLPELDALDLMHKVQLMVISKKKQIQQAASRKRTIHAQKTVISKRSLRSSSPMHVLSRSPSPSTSPETEVFAQFANTNSCLEDPLTPGQIRVKKENMN
ncbi:THAP domain-containing protein 7-like isoform X3 [Pectinophora gossypiella]|uniref:THAP domain-containing protein 7-like isoform X3 n=1 Tax=Pectinophora gossypiella TaxID=13191 RepID=UPI00214E8076|nr:THAP domain-containing protein 7-like isoform X3 [Pectinophora gossypiella]